MGRAIISKATNRNRPKDGLRARVCATAVACVPSELLDSANRIHCLIPLRRIGENT
jgi:hypothetical protein